MGRKHLVPLQSRTSNQIAFRFLDYQKSLGHTTRHHGTKWASCEIDSGTKKETKVIFGISTKNLTSAARAVYEPTTPNFTTFTDPCPLGKQPKVKTAKAKTATPDKPKQVKSLSGAAYRDKIQQRGTRRNTPI